MQTVRDVSVDAFLELYNQQKNDTYIANCLNTSRKVISRIRKKLKLPPLYTKDIDLAEAEKLKLVKELISQGKNDSQIAVILNCNSKQVNYFRFKHKLAGAWNRNSYKNLTERRKGYILRNLRDQAKGKSVPFDLNLEDLVLPKYCPIFGVKLLYGYPTNHPNQYSVDRIIPSLGYVKDNIIIISKKANLCKSNLSIDELELFCNRFLKFTSKFKTEGVLGAVTDILTNIENYNEDEVSLEP